jgi:Na+-translocating ferredoxin:NAD+ oxidoreductase subunit D
LLLCNKRKAKASPYILVRIMMKVAEEDKLIVSVSPHIRSVESIPKVMWTVVGALVPAGIVGIFMFGYRCLWIIFLCVATTVIIEAVCQKLRGRSITINDGSAVITGLLLAYTLPPGVPIYIPVIGAAFGIIVVKHTFGGLGNNIWNPALAARAFLQIAYPTSMNSGWRTHVRFLLYGYGYGNHSSNP